MSEGNAGNWVNSVYLRTVNFSNIAVNDIIYLTCTKNDGADNAKIVLYRQNYQKIGDVESWPETEMVSSTQSTADFAYTIDSDILALLQDASLANIAIKGTDYTLTKVSIKKHFSAIKTTLSSAEVQLGNWANQYEVESSSLANVKAGDFYYMPSTKQMTKEDASAVDWWQAQFYYDWTNLYNVAAADHDVWAEIQAADVDNIKANTLHVKGEYYNATGLYLIHPVTSFKIGSIGYATFSADQEVTVPEGLTAYKATVSGENVSLTPFTDNVIPANTGAIIKGAQGSVVEFLASSTGSTEASDLIAVTAATVVTTLDSNYDYYVLYNNATGGNTALGLEDGDLACGWNSSYTNKVITFDDAWKGRGWGWNFDYSDYSKIVIEFESAPKSGIFKVEYSDGTADEAGYAEGSTSVELELNETKKSAISQFYLSASEASTLTLTNAYLVSNGGSAVAEFRKTETGTLAANKAYLRVAKGGGAKLNIIFGEEEQQGETDGITLPTTYDLRPTTTYNLAGQRVGNDYKGLVIVNGKKVIRK